MDELIYQLKETALPTIVSVSILVFLLTGITYGGAIGIFEIIGKTPTVEVTDGYEHKTPEEIKELQNVKLPEISIAGNIYNARTQIRVDEMFAVEKDGVIYNGTEGAEGGFSLVLTEVGNQNGDLILARMTMEEYEALVEVPYTAIYDEGRDVLFFTQPGVYKLYITCMLEGGVSGKVTVSIPVRN